MIEVDEPTSRIERDELLGLLNTTTRPENQRITARIPVVTLQELLQPGEDQEPPAEVVVTFRPVPPHPLLMISEYGWAMMVASVLATVTFGVAAVITLW